MRVKICGITDVAYAQMAVLAGADAIGLNFYPRSPRYVSHEQAAAILRELPAFVDAVGVYVNLPLGEAFTHARDLGVISTVQCHGDLHEPPPSPSLRFLPAFAIREQESLAAACRYLDVCAELGLRPAAILLDGWRPGEYGGTGQPPPWELLNDLDLRWGTAVVLAGGLTPENVAEAIRRVRPYAVDVASGVESAPGHKDPEKLRRFIGNAREAAARWL
jgi:phosphoribosylanthranilate isomerase